MNRSDATVAICKCRETHKTFGVRFEKVSQDLWKYTWAFPMKASTAKREGYDNTVITGSIEPDLDYLGCPYCGIKYFVICSCGRLNCNILPNGIFKCEWCGATSGYLTDYDGGGIKSGGDR